MKVTFLHSCKDLRIPLCSFQSKNQKAFQPSKIQCDLDTEDLMLSSREMAMKISSRRDKWVRKTKG